MTSKINNVVHDVIPNDKKDSLKRTPEKILEKVAEHFHVTVQELKGAARSEQIVLARKVSMYLMRKLITDITLKEIGNVLGRRDHTSVIHGIKTINERLKIDDDLANGIYKLQKEFDATNEEENRSKYNLKEIRKELKTMLQEGECLESEMIILIVLVVLERCEKHEAKEWEKILFDLSADQKAVVFEELENASDQRKKEIFSLGKAFHVAGKLLGKIIDIDDSQNDVLEAIRIMWTV